MILDNMSAFFQFENCKFGNEKYKKNCARLGVHRDFHLNLSYTIESSCFGYEVKGTDEVEQFKEYHFLKFGEHLAHGIAKQFQVEVDEMDKANMTYGFDIDLDFGLYTKDPKELKKQRRRRRRELETVERETKKEKRRKNGMRDSRESFNGSARSGFGHRNYHREKESRHGHERSREYHDNSSR